MLTRRRKPDDYCNNIGCGDPAGPVDPTGRVVFWTDQALLVPIAVQLGSEPVEVITTPFSTTPACGQSGVANYTVNEGSYSVVAADAGSHRWTNSVSVTKGMCLAVRYHRGRSTTAAAASMQAAPNR